MEDKLDINDIENEKKLELNANTINELLLDGFLLEKIKGQDFYDYCLKYNVGKTEGEKLDYKYVILEKESIDSKGNKFGWVDLVINTQNKDIPSFCLKSKISFWGIIWRFLVSLLLLSASVWVILNWNTEPKLHNFITILLTFALFPMIVIAMFYEVYSNNYRKDIDMMPELTGFGTVPIDHTYFNNNYKMLGNIKKLTKLFNHKSCDEFLKNKDVLVSNSTFYRIVCVLCGGYIRFRIVAKKEKVEKDIGKYINVVQILDKIYLDSKQYDL